MKLEVEAGELTGMEGKYVKLKDTIETFGRLMAGEFDVPISITIRATLSPRNFFGKAGNRIIPHKLYFCVHPFERYRLARI